MMRRPTAWTWVSGPSTLSGPFGHITGAVEDSLDGAARIVVLHADRGGRPLPSHLLHEGYRVDDHIAPGIASIDGGTVLAAFAGHGDAPELGLVRLRIDADGMVEEDRRTVPLPDVSTYAHVLDVGDAAGRFLVITRAIDWCPTGIWVHPSTLEASKPFKMLSPVNAPDAADRLTGVGGRPYLVTRQQHGSAIVALVDDHPGAFRNGLVVAEISGGWWQRLDGTRLRAVDDPAEWDAFAVLDRVLPTGGEWVPWVHDVGRGQSGRPSVAWSERRRLPDGTASGSIRYRVAELRGRTWFLHPPLYAGEPLYPEEPDYAAGIAFAGNTTDLWVASSVDPLTGDGPATERRIYRVRLNEGSPDVASTGWEPGEDLMRPRVSQSTPSHPGATWMLAGEYRSYKAFATRPVVRVHLTPRGPS